MVAAPDGVRADVESRDMLEQAASTLIRPAHKMSLNMVISFSMGEPPADPAAKDASARYRRLALNTDGRANRIAEPRLGYPLRLRSLSRRVA
jgi:hypothetical protein